MPDIIPPGARKRSVQTMAPLRRREAAGRPARAIRAPAGVRQCGRQKCLRVSSRKPRPQEREARDRARPPETPARHEPAPDRHPDGPGLQARSAQRIEQVARRAARNSAMLREISARGWASTSICTGPNLSCFLYQNSVRWPKVENQLYVAKHRRDHRSLSLVGGLLIAMAGTTWFRSDAEHG